MILAGGLGLRLRPITFAIPKPLIAVNGVPLIHGIINHFQSFGVKQIYISTGYLSDLVKAYIQSQNFKNVGFEFLEEREKLGTAGPLSLIKNRTEPFDILLTNGDLIFDLNLDRFYKNFLDSSAEISVVTKTITEQSRFGIIKTNFSSGMITEIIEKPTSNLDINCGIYLIKSNIINLVPTDINYDMPDLIKSAIASSKKVIAYKDNFEWACIDNISDLNSVSLRD
jgi:NDP-sugar pyrophosphorylase family protein